jgi:hypothetical protein
VKTIADLTRPMALLRLLAVDHPNLPAPHVNVSPHRSDVLQLSVHGDLATFEAWREALGVDPKAVRHHLQSGDTTVVLTGFAEIADAKVELVGYSTNVAGLLVEAVA